MTALGFGCHQDALDFASDGIQDANCRAAFHPVEIVKSYKEGNVAIVLKASAGADAREFDLVFFAVPRRHHKVATADFRIIDGHAGANQANGDEEAVLVGITELVHSPEGIIPSLVSVEAPKQRPDFLRQITASTLCHTVQVGNRIGHREISVLGIAGAARRPRSVSRLIQRRSQRLKALRQRQPNSQGSGA